MRKLGYGLLITTGLLIGPLAGAQGTGQAPDPRTDAQQHPCCPHGMMGGGRMGPGMGGAGMSCPLRAMADVKVEQTPTGAVLRFTAKDPAQVAEVQSMVQGMLHCMSGSGTGQQGQQPAPGQQRR
ncbi:MAG TPA: hypothetical protein VFZ09_21550 [Archangium sp.]|uniref:hypothetical protein n=1 Tax=Archangium sp. TaxID=1872627 RepID=UPI002E33BE8E|nr:hypothetical protein [Archangium sp.]HEX5748841.1 hypothetical protein [Archangium sp.]